MSTPLRQTPGLLHHLFPIVDVSIQQLPCSDDFGVIIPRPALLPCSMIPHNLAKLLSSQLLKFLDRSKFGQREVVVFVVVLALGA